jgi:dihydroorotate dehydrogenase electron transfer subunit
MTGPVHEVATVREVREVGAYRWLGLAAPGVAARVRPGQFVAVAVGEEPTSTLLRRVFSVHRADPAAGTVEVVVAAHGVGSRWVTGRSPGDALDLAGPLGQPFPVPESGAESGPESGAGPGSGTAGASAAVLIGGGYGAAPLGWLAGDLRARGVDVHVVLGAADSRRLFGADGARDVVGADRVRVTTEDGSVGVRGRVTDVLADLLAPGVEVYACGPMPMLRAVTDLAAAHGARAWCTVEESMACGIGVCMSCVLPVRGADGVTRMVRSCVEGPTFDGAALRWDAVGGGPGGRGSRVPEDCLGAPTAGPGH